MANIETAEVTNGTLKPTGAGSLIRDAQYGIDAVLSGYIIQNVSINCRREYDTTYDQKNAIVSELDTDVIWEMSMEVIGGSGTEDPDELTTIQPGKTDFSWANHLWKIRSVEYKGTYNDKKRYTITGFRAKNFPAQASA